ncbi:Sensory histidine kinase AtoS [Sinorhizobium sojae CCBAU 05684]|uniref:histidine kinase n=1 Tax=Sinorhizobium sojae CCBAU 05684 TaxID=716928 RepID=A0A249P7R0_9HYPH|nr:ATP-binding protein [Sinorhizobium sojae]ASY61785.1 Sensory histidine kinase AtoS [Sinorhizobium sojae CCBAU 05684]
MPARQYPFIDIAVHARVREHFARGDASVLFSKDLARALWANDQGAKLFGMASVYDFIDSALDLSDLSLRQLHAAAAQLSAVGDRRQLLIRISSGFRRLPLNATVELIRIRPDEEAVLFTTPHNGKALSTGERAAAMISGLDGPDTHMAVLDDEGDIIAQSPGFERLGLPAPVRRTLVTAVARDKDRLIKRPVATDKGQLPAAIGKISDYPALHLLFAVEAILEEATAVAAESTAQPATEQAAAEAQPALPDRPAQVTEVPDSDMEPPAPVARETSDDTGDDPFAQAPGEVLPEALDEANLQASSEQVPAPEKPDEAVTDESEGAAPVADFNFNPGGRAVRFVWKIDAEGRFSEISEEFASAVGPSAADVVGLTFDELAARYDLDPDNKINELLHRRDTWSGKTILWPVEGTNLKVPVDLAALPTYSRTREFDGFRGFGIVRIADAVPDEKASGLSLGAMPHQENIPSEGVDEQPEPLAVPEPETKTVAEPTIGAAPDDEPETSSKQQAAAAEHGFAGERPALRVVDAPERPSSDKIIDLDVRRPTGSGTLTRGEQAAFREIARQLGAHFGAPPAAEPAGADETRPPAEAPPAEEAPPAPLSIESRLETADQEPPAPAGDEAGPARTGVAMSSEILDSLPVALLVHHGDDLLHANPEFLRLTGYADLEAFAHEGGLAALFATGEEARASDPDGTMTLVRESGEFTPVNAHLHSIRWEGRSALMLAVSPTPTRPDGSEPQDGDRFAETEAELRTEIDELRSILETATDGVVILGQDGDIRTMNGSASALFNYDEDAMRGKPFAALFAHESQKAVIDYLQGLSGHGVASVLNDGREVIGREAGGGFIPLFMTIGRLSSSNGYCAVIRDITQWKRTEDELRSAKRAAETANAHKTEFLARVSHEIRTPLNAIIGFSDMMASEHFGPIGHPRYIEYAGDIGRSGRHVLDIVNDLLDISKIEAGEMELDFSAVDLNEAVSEAVSLVQPQANSQRVIIRTSLSASVPEVVADGRSIKQIALNILANAIRFTPSGGQIVVSTSYEANGSVILRIRDTGSGMTRNELDQAMKPFRQVTTGGRKRGDGTGLGLPLTKAMAEANRAHFSINSAPNEGTLVEISFPSQRVLAN